MEIKEALEILDTIPTIGDQVDALEMAIQALELQADRPSAFFAAATGKYSGITLRVNHLDDLILLSSETQRRLDELNQVTQRLATCYTRIDLDIAGGAEHKRESAWDRLKWLLTGK